MIFFQNRSLSNSQEQAKLSSNHLTLVLYKPNKKKNTDIESMGICNTLIR